MVASKKKVSLAKVTVIVNVVSTERLKRILWFPQIKNIVTFFKITVERKRIKTCIKAESRKRRFVMELTPEHLKLKNDSPKGKHNG
jgi:hypothetical protein